MNKKFLLFLSIIFLLGMVSQASALSLTIGDAYYLGFINDGVPSSPTDEVDYINNLTELAAGAGPVQDGTEYYDRIGSLLGDGPFPLATLTGAFKDQSAPFEAPAGYMYILGKYGAGPSGGGSYVWYFASGFDESITLPTSSPGGPGLSHISAYNNTPSVPEPSTMFLLGIGLVGLVGCSRKVRK